MERSPQASSSAISAPVMALRSPPPPFALGSAFATRPSSWARAITSSGSFRASLHSRARGRTSLAANWRTVSTISRCSSLGSKSITSDPARCHSGKSVEIIQEIEAGVNWPGRAAAPDPPAAGSDARGLRRADFAP